uniref:Phosphomannomutase n=1 Tax=uncultured delta proteobacterium HF0010_10I05 TaxID=710822 RepID=E0XX37_9DELT|nr:phosphomannomutase [uncultured delta proteobacterium HF0010_10I05]
MSNVREIAQYWAETNCFDETTREEAKLLLETATEEELMDRFGTTLEFGTGGLRGVMGVGLNRMNRYTVMQATEGLARYIEKRQETDASGVVVGFDSRNNSEVFAHAAAEVLARHGIRVYLFRDIVPTPVVSYALLQKKAVAAIILTASHNPPEYNGYKVYWKHGGQIIPPDDEMIIDEVRSVDDIAEIPQMDFEEALQQGRIEWIEDDIDPEYLEKLLPLSFGKPSQNEQLGVVYTPLHGTGGRLVPRLLKERGFTNLHCVASQMVPDGNFSTVLSPNPEDAAAYELPIAEAQAEHQLILANDPDADRLGVMVRNNQQEWVRLNGNQIGALLLDFVLGVLQESGKLPENGLYIGSIVTSPLGKRIAEHYGLAVKEVLTGFKWIWSVALQAESKSQKFLFGMEESHGYLMGNHTGDKDGVWAAMAFAEMVASLKAQGSGPIQRLEKLYQQYGFHLDSLHNRNFLGLEGKQQMELTLSQLRENPPERLAGLKVRRIIDLLTDQERIPGNPEIQVGPGLPRSNVIILQLEQNARVIVRPSGTEPKLKYYFNLSGEREELQERLAQLKASLGLST